jgi:hypothetical protein
MGRYAFFSTGLEYKFTFAVQESEDILKFGGFHTSKCEMKWISSDADFILRRLHQIEKLFGWSEFDFSKFSEDLNGTEEICYDKNNSFDLTSKCGYEYYLGCLIYHQLLYTDILTCHFEW